MIEIGWARAWAEEWIAAWNSGDLDRILSHYSDEFSSAKDYLCVKLTDPLFSVFEMDISGRDLVLILGGLFLIGKATHEIHEKLEGESKASEVKGPARSLMSIILQIMVIDIVFSLDSVITAVGMVDYVSIMIAANVVALFIMLGAAGPISAFVDRHPTIKMLALSFLLLIGTNLVAEGFGAHIPKGYTYAAMAFSFLVEMLNLRLRAKGKPVDLHDNI